MTRVYILRGGFVGWDGIAVSPGMSELRARLSHIPGVVADTWNWSSWPYVCDSIAALKSTDHVVLIGYSGGGMSVSYICNRVHGRRIELVIGYDPSPPNAIEPLEANVDRCVCFFNRNPGFPWSLLGYGGGKYIRAVSNRHTNLVITNVSENHALVQSDNHLHDITEAEVVSVAR